MCLDIVTVCPACDKVAEQCFQTCSYQGPAAGHKVYRYRQAVQSPMVHWWSCSTVRCDMNWDLHRSLTSRHQNALLEGTGYSQFYPYKPLEFDDEGDEACELAVTPEEVNIMSGGPSPDLLSAKARLFVRDLLLKGLTNTQIADALHRSPHATLYPYSGAYISKYISAYIRPNLKLYGAYKQRSPPKPRAPPAAPAPKQAVDEEESEDEEACFFLETMMQVPGAPAPKWLSAGEVRWLLAMRRQGKSKQSMAKALGKPRVQLVQYINAYVDPYEETVLSTFEEPVLPTAGPSKRKRSDESQSGPRRSSKRLRQ